MYIHIHVLAYNLIEFFFFFFLAVPVFWCNSQAPCTGHILGVDRNRYKVHHIPLWESGVLYLIYRCRPGTNLMHVQSTLTNYIVSYISRLE